ncbi:MAG: copper-translocating P-type ATPase [Nitrososphaeraceae archaeon]
MKKLDDKIVIKEEKKAKEVGGGRNNNNTNNDTSCDCCCSNIIASETSTEEKGQEFNQEHQGKDNERRLSNPKLLIVIGLALTIPIVLLELLFHHSIVTDYIIALTLATPVQFILGKPFYLRFYRTIKQRKGFTTDTLVVLSTSVAYGYSLVNLLAGSDLLFFEASASVLTIFTIGEYLESRVLKTTSESLRNLLALKPKKATVIRRNIKGKEEEQVIINSDDIVARDIVIVKPGEKIATDGIVVHGESSVDESMITGESIPIDKKMGDKVIGGTINKNGYLQFKATNVGSHTVLASIIDMVKKARMSKAPVQRIADRAVRYFVPIVLSIALGSSLYWLFVAHQPISFAITVFATILVVSCPCALGIATPMVISLGIDKAAKEGVLIKGGQYLEKLSSVDTIVFDKTGTLTKGKPEVTDVIPINGYSEFEILQLAASTEIKSEHPIAQSIVRKAYEKSIPILKVSDFNSLTGHGVLATYLEKRIFIGNFRKDDDEDNNNINNRMIITRAEAVHEKLQQQQKITELESEGKTVVTVFVEDKLAGLIAVADILRENAKQVIDKIQYNMKKEVILMSGDNKTTANAIAKELGITTVLAQVSPESKALEIKKLQQNQAKKVVVAMVGDGINDAPALTTADIGIAIGSGTDVALSSGHIILMKSDLNQIVYALKLAKYSMKKIKQNLAMSFTYNVVTISIAAGLLYGITNSLVLTPALAALGWVISDSAVFGNSVLLKKFV